MTKISKVDKAIYQALLLKHQKKHAGCDLSERRCKYSDAEDCIVQGSIDQFHAHTSRCNRCKVVANKEYYELVTTKEKALERDAKKRKKAKKQ